MAKGVVTCTSCQQVLECDDADITLSQDQPSPQPLTQRPSRRRSKVSPWVPESRQAVWNTVLSPNQRKVINKFTTTKTSTMDEVLVEGFMMQIRRRHAMSLQDRTWLLDDIINFYFQLLGPRAASNTVHIFNSFWWVKLYAGRRSFSYDNVKNWTRHLNIFTKQLILIPIHLPSHWAMVSIHMRERSIVYSDSLGGKGTLIFKNVSRYLSEEWKVKHQGFKEPVWTYVDASHTCNLPQQMGGTECGVFVCGFAYCLSQDVSVHSFTAPLTSFFRKSVALSIVNKDLHICHTPKK